MFDWCHIWNMVCAHQKKFLISACSNFRSCWIPRSSSHINVYSPNLVLPPSAFRGSNAHYGQPGPVCHSASRLSLVSIRSLPDNTGFFSLMRWKPTLLSTTGTLDHQQDLRPTSTGFFKALVGSVSSVSDLYLTLFFPTSWSQTLFSTTGTNDRRDDYSRSSSQRTMRKGS